MHSLKKGKIPPAAVCRLALYVQALEEMERNGLKTVSSCAIADACAVTSSQVRKDLAYFGEFGVRGVGYTVTKLIGEIKASIGGDRIWKAVIVGIGNLGKALLNYEEFRSRDFLIIGAYDSDPFKIGEKVCGLEITCISKLKAALQKESVDLGIIATPPERAQHSADYLIEAGIRGILNFAPTRIQAPHHVVVQSVNFFNYLYTIMFKLLS